MQLAINCSGDILSAAANCMELPSGIRPHVACKLLLTAAVRRHVEQLQHWLRDDQMKHCLDAATHEAVYKQLIIHDLAVQLPHHMELPAAAQLSSDAIAQLLVTAAELCRRDWFVQVAAEPAAAELSSEQVGNVLLAVLQQAQHWGSMVKFVEFDYVYLGGHQQQMRPIVTWEGREWGVEGYMSALGRLPGAAGISSSVMGSLLLSAVLLTNWRGLGELSVDVMCALPEARNLSSDHMVQLLKAGFHQDKDAAARLCQVPAFKQLSESDVEELLLAAAECGDVDGMCELCALQASEGLRCAAVLPALEEAVKQRSSLCTHALCRLPAVDWLGTEAVTLLLLVAISCGSGGCTEQLCKILAAQQLSSDAVAQLLQAALQVGSAECAELLSKLPAAQKLKLASSNALMHTL
jgi:hypothetical protein